MCHHGSGYACSNRRRRHHHVTCGGSRCLNRCSSRCLFAVVGSGGGGGGGADGVVVGGRVAGVADGRHRRGVGLGRLQAAAVGRGGGAGVGRGEARRRVEQARRARQRARQGAAQLALFRLPLRLCSPVFEPHLSRKYHVYRCVSGSSQTDIFTAKQLYKSSKHTSPSFLGGLFGIIADLM